MAALLFAINYRYKRVSFIPLFLLFTVAEYFAVRLICALNVGYDGTVEFILPIIFLLLSLLYALYHKMRRLQIIVIFSIFLWYFSTFQESIFELLPFLILCAIGAWTAYRADSRKWFNTSVLLAVLRILIYYADVDNLQYMGFYLIGAGVLMVATILLLIKYNPFKEIKHEK